MLDGIRSLRGQSVAIYIRVSTADMNALMVQRKELIDYARFVLGIEKYVVFEDAGYSAINTDRPNYQKMIERIHAGEFTHLLVWSVDRISRNITDFSSMYEELKSLGVTFVSKKQFDASTATDESILNLILEYTELERDIANTAET